MRFWTLHFWIGAAIYLGITMICLPLSGAVAAELAVAVSIKPIHSLVAGVMAGVGKPHLIVRGGGSPHAYSLSPGDARALQSAKAVFWVGEGLEVFLGGSIKKLAKEAVVSELSEAPGVTLLEFREEGPERGHERDHDDHPGHGHHEEDMHLWLDPVNAKAMVAEIVRVLSTIDPINGPDYKANGANLQDRLSTLITESAARLTPARNKPFAVFHDAYQYLEKRFGLTVVGAVTLSPDRRPGAETLRKMREKIKASGTVCIFAEPQFVSKLVRVAVEGTGARVATLDPLGADLQDGPDLYFKLMERNIAAILSCL